MTLVCHAFALDSCKIPTQFLRDISETIRNMFTTAGQHVYMCPSNKAHVEHVNYHHVTIASTN